MSFRSVAFVAGTQYLFCGARPARQFLDQWRRQGRSTFSLWSPKVGMLWDVDPTWQVFGNISRSAEVPSFGESVSPNFRTDFPTIPFFLIKPQTATTYEIGTRGKRPDFTWDCRVYRADIRDELQCHYSSFGNCNVTNLDRTIHQGIEAGRRRGDLQGTIFVTAMARQDLAESRLYAERLPLRQRSDLRQQQLPGAPPHYLRAELLYKHPSGFYVGPNIEWVPESYFVDSANTLKTEPYALGTEGRFDNGGTYSPYVEARNSPIGLHLFRQHYRQGDSGVAAVRTRLRVGPSMRA